MTGILLEPTFAQNKWNRNLVWALSHILRGGMITIPVMYLRAALRGLCSVLYLNEPKLIVDATWAIAYIADDMGGGTQIDAVLETPLLLPRLMELLDDKDTMRAALRALGNLVAGGDNQTQQVLDAGLLSNMVCCNKKVSNYQFE
ncbi:unnamed protein product [Gongylonema pulchrum]|uniref:Importin subunit alpha-1-like n=1 Tax=Gongylonema pulchrum TaxID=637853 RepID=A0A183EZ69_9BILA|nr:unnamed protein product [Gongylonema pulchrum]